jgi:hypothetical protein
MLVPACMHLSHGEVSALTPPECIDRDIVLEERLQKSLAERHANDIDSPLFLTAYLGRSVLAMASGYILQPILLHATANLFGIKPSVRPGWRWFPAGPGCQDHALSSERVVCLLGVLLAAGG